MSVPPWACVPRSSPNVPVTVPFTGVTVPQSPPSAAGAVWGSGSARSRARRSSPSSCDSAGVASPCRGRRRRCASRATGVVGLAWRCSISSRTTDGTSLAFMNTTFERKIDAHVCASTTPVTSRPCDDWKRLTARSVIGPKIPSSSTARRCCELRDLRRRCSRTSGGPSRSGPAPERRRPGPATSRCRACAPATDSTGATGEVATAPVSATVVALRRRRERRATSARRRLRRARSMERAQRRSSARSRSPGKPVNRPSSSWVTT